MIFGWLWSLQFGEMVQWLVELVGLVGARGYFFFLGKLGDGESCGGCVL